MSMKIRVSGSDIKIVREELIATGSENAYEIEFHFDKNWNSMVNKTAVFYQPSVNRDNPLYQIIGDDNKLIIPSSQLVANDYLYIGVFGFTEDGEVRLPTIYTYTYVKQGCYKRSEEPTPDPSVYEQIYLMAFKAVEIATSVREDADSGKFDGYSPTVTVKEETPDTYILTITNRDGSYDTPNLISVTSSSNLTYIHEQVEASSRWVINHNLRKYPSVTIVDSADTVVNGEVTYQSINTVIVEFSAPFSGKAYLNGSSGENTGDSTYVYEQLDPSSRWVVNHRLNKYPSVTVVNNSNIVVNEDIIYESANTIIIEFSVPFTGKAYLN